MLLIITTSYDPTPNLRQFAMNLAAEYGFIWADRERHPISYFKHKYDTNEIIVVTSQGLKLIAADASEFSFHPSMAMIRCKRWLGGEGDTLLACSGAQPGDHILDCTAGMASDAMMFALQVGSAGQVTALESEFIPYLLSKEGLKCYVSEIDELNEAMRRIDMTHADHTAYLQQCQSKSVDIVYFDPMFRRPVQQSSAIKPLRLQANEQPISNLAITEAKRVARKTVVLKEHRHSDEFVRLGFTDVRLTQSKVAYGVMRCHVE